MATIKLNRPSKEGFNAISKALFELTGNEYYLRPLCEQEDKPNKDYSALLHRNNLLTCSAN